MIDEDIKEGSGLKKTLSYPVILLITINSILGTGIFFLPALGAKVAGPASIISWVILSFIAIYTAMCFGELASMFPTAGGVYEYTKQAYGRFTSFIIGWMALIAGNLTIAMLVVGAIQYIVPDKVPFVNILLAVVLIVLFNVTAYRGMELSSMMLVAFAFITLGSLSVLIIPGLFAFKASNLSPFFVFPASSILVAMFLIVETFFGWETTTFLASETKDGHKVLPKALVVGTVIISIISLLFVVTSLGAMNWQQFGLSLRPLTELSMLYFGAKGGGIFTLFKQLSAIHPKYKTPHKAIIFQTLLTIALVFAGSHIYTTLLSLLVPLVLVMYSVIMFSVVLLRYKKPDIKRYYKAPLGKFLPIVVIIFYFTLIFGWLNEGEAAWPMLKLVISLIVIGVPCFFLISLYHDPKIISDVRDVTANLSFFTEAVTLPRRIRNEILKLIGNVTGKTLLEYGCSVGTLTVQLAEAVGPSGRVFALDLSKNDLKITKRRVDRAIWSEQDRIYGRVNLLHDPELINRGHPGVPYADVTVSVGMLAYIQDIEKVLKDINALMPDGGKICVIEFVDFFRIIPNVEWLSKNEVIESIFRKAGFSVHVVRKKGLFWNYVFVNGIKSKKDVVYI